jgi:hypothetical protein
VRVRQAGENSWGETCSLVGADTLARFVARNFVVAELNAESTDIAETLKRAQLPPGAVRELPAAFVISHGAVQVVDFRRAELTRGYSRTALLRILRQSVTLAQADHPMATTAD